MTHLLTPRPMSPAQIADLVARARKADTESRGQAVSNQAARYAFEHHIPLAQAARRFGRTPGAVQNAWRRLFPRVNPLLSRRCRR